ncbi:tetratricopeptide repeat protein [Streptomyces phaeolivaceus]|uniref:Tetratricopeptide repeat protein n=1 Tax=Streptomyces phaeolivaceus TaxID=2653200 RepID=A0A5P8KG09_9ACTN|nr:helix-turn-helix domain-containing protein [Streptomyces phaeolivaceus]QFR02206.1 tetratricopeptide repeat protein [Streptomyces phaeolivaceus]
MLGELLRDHRRRLGLTQEELAERAGVSVRTISHLETGRINRPRPATMRQLAEALALADEPLQQFAQAATDRPGTTPTLAPMSPAPEPRPGWNAPAQLPAPLANFVGRTAQLHALETLLGGDSELDAQQRQFDREQSVGAPGTVVISAIAGTAGVGKTALAVYWAARAAHRFPDGQLYVNLRGFHPTESVMTSGEAIRGFLEALGVPAEQIAVEAEAQIGLYRSLFAGKRILVLLDNARDAEQVRPLLPGSPGCLALVTSRNQLTGLVACDGAQPLPLDLLTEDEARHLLIRRLGAARVAAERDAVAEIVTRCARLPLALAIVAARAAMNPRFPLSGFARELGEAGAGLTPFAGGDPSTDMRGVFSWSYNMVGGEAARMFRLLGLHPGPDIGTEAVASLCGLPPGPTRSALSELELANLLGQHLPGRYTLHDLLRVYAGELTRTLDAEADRGAALRRLLDHYLHSAVATTAALSRHREPILTAEPAPGVTPERPDAYEPALAWFAAELPNLIEAVRTAAARTGFEAHAWQLACAMVSFFDLTGHWQEWVETHLAALDAAQRVGDTAGEARTLRNLARVHSRQGRDVEAVAALRRSHRLCRDLGDRVGQAQALRFLSNVLGRLGKHTLALSHAQQALELLRAVGHLVGQGRVLNQIGWQLSHLGDHRRAVEYCRQALRVLQECDDPDGEGATWDSLGFAHRHLGEHDEAITCFQEALRLRRDRDDSFEVAETLAHLGDALLDAGHHDQGRRALHQALEILEQLDHGDAGRIRARIRRCDTPTSNNGHESRTLG